MTLPVPRLGGIVLCGGRSSRMGSPKAWLDFGGEPLLARVVRTVRRACAPVIVVAAPGQDVPPLPPDVPIARDPIEGRGPLQGIAAGLHALLESPPRSEGIDAAFVTSTDAPFLAPALIARLAALRGNDHDIAVPHTDDHFHPLTAIYSPTCLAHIEALLAADRRRPFFLFERVRTIICDAPTLLADPDLAAADPALRSFENLNTPDDYARAVQSLGLRAGPGPES
ncbi:MAG: molybdenum cofactor guanylyltransferase [bacterium]